MTMMIPFRLYSLALITVAVVLSSRATAQVIPDGTLGPESSLLIDVSAVEQLIQGGGAARGQSVPQL